VKRFCAAALLMFAAACAPSVSESTTAPVGVEVMVTATPVRSGDQVELCPPGMAERCPGIFWEGGEEPPPAGQVITVRGEYDGSRLLGSGPAEAVDRYPPLEPGDFSTRCPDLEGGGSPDTIATAVTDYTVTVPESFAGMWWDERAQVMTIWMVGTDFDDHRSAIIEAAGRRGVCVIGGARFSEVDLLEASQILSSYRDSRGRPLSTPGFGIDVVDNRIELVVQEIDQATRQDLVSQLGERVAIYPYLEVLDQELAALPAPRPVVAGNVDLLTSSLRYGGGMDALGRFVVGYDSERNCIYFEGNEASGQGRTVPVWPFGYSATNDPVEIFDYDGGFVAGQGQALELGGGFADVSLIEGETCGAVSGWIVNA
jgi:hypothetical protein